MKSLNRLLILLTLLPVLAAAQGAPPLTVVVVIDQLPTYLLDRNYDLFRDDGFKRLERDGVLFTECRYTHAVTETGPGHATISTGCNPAQHGIVSNGWNDVTGADQYCFGCPDAKRLCETGIVDSVAASCPDNLRRDGLADAWRAKFGAAAGIFCLSVKDRAAIALGGRAAELALWVNWSDGKFESSSYYGTSLPDWCVAYNQNWSAYFDVTWNKLRASEAYAHADGDTLWYEVGDRTGLGNSFPKSLRGDATEPDKQYVRRLLTSPFGNDYLYGLALSCIEHENLGLDSVPDLLCVSFSCNDICGHTFGPQSEEMIDMMLRTDSLIADLLTRLDTWVGEGNYWFALTADHGVCPACESSLVPQGMGGRFEFEQMRDSLNAHLAERFAVSVIPEHGFCSDLGMTTNSLQRATLKTLGLNVREAALAACAWLEQQPGVADAVLTIHADDVAAIEDERLRGHIERSFYPGRFGDFYLHPLPYWQTASITVTHGSIHEYDTHVPLYLMGKPFGRGRNSAPCDPMDLATTLGASAGLRWETSRDGMDRRRTDR